MTEDLNKAYDEGYALWRKSVLCALPPPVNPYPHRSRSWNAWEDGADMALTDSVVPDGEAEAVEEDWSI
jgi:hypothetical protein